MTGEPYQERWNAALMNNYGTPALELVKGSGAEVWDSHGRRYLDLVSGVAVNALGHAHPAVVAAVTAQIQQLGHVSNFFVHEPVLRLAERLQGLLEAPDSHVLFCNSGAEANETAFKIARRTGRPHIVAAQNAFHGRTMGALALTGQQPKRAPFEPLPPGVSHVPYGDAAALDAAVDADTAAVVLEPILGEAGVDRAARGLPARRARDHRRPRGAARDRRGADRHRPHRRRGSPTSPPGSGRTSSRWPRGSAAACRSGRASASGMPAGCSNPASTAPPSAATPSAAPPRSRCSTRSPARGCWSTCSGSARRSPPGSRPWATRSSPTSAEPG